MHDMLTPMEKFSPYGGKMILEEVKGSTSGQINPENNVETVKGKDRTMYSYIPSSGCPHAKQGAVLMVLRDENTETSAEQVMHNLKLDILAETNHFILLFPNPLETGWNFDNREEKESDIQFLVRCFASLPRSKGGVAGFNGMIYYLATSPTSSALVTTLACCSPLDAAAIMIGRYPENYVVPSAQKIPQVAWIYERNEKAKNWLEAMNSPIFIEDGVQINKDNPCIKMWYRDDGLNAETVKESWDKMFSETRRWRNDTFGIYQPRINFSKKGYIAHMKDSSLTDNGGFAHTWYEYVPEQLRNTTKKVPLVLYLHGINCTALYGAEQSGWSDLADREEFIVVYPNPSIEERWNVWDDPRIPSDMDYLLALINHMKQTYPIDETKIYVSGFSMGSMMTNAMAQSYPEIFAGAVACNGPAQGYLMTLDQSAKGMLLFRPNSIVKDLSLSNESISKCHKRADEKKGKYDYLMPFVQFAGELDNAGFDGGNTFPMQAKKTGMWIDTINYWKKYNHISVIEDMFTDDNISGLKADVNEMESERFFHQTWKNDNGNELYHFITVARMPHAVDLKEIELGWQIIKNYSRKNDGSLLVGE